MQETRQAKRWRRRLVAGILLGLFVAFAIALVGSYAFYRYAPAPSGGPGGANALWAAHQWVGRTHSAAAYDDLVEELRRHDIRHVFFHVGPLDGDGSIPREKYPNAAALNAQIKARDPALRLHAWIGQVERRGGGPLDLSDGPVRARIVRTAAEFLDLGFDGIHYNIEPIHSGNPDILALLDETVPVTRLQGKGLSLATYELSPFPGAEFLARLVFPRVGLWRGKFYRAVAERVDFVAVMMYDTALPYDWLYGSFVAWQSYRLAKLLGGRTGLFMGVPSYEDQRAGFYPEAENVASALRGIKMALSYLELPDPDHFGVAIYARWTTDAAEWATYRREWLDEP